MLLDYVPQQALATQEKMKQNQNLKSSIKLTIYKAALISALVYYSDIIYL